MKKNRQSAESRRDWDRAVSEITQQRLNAVKAGQIVIDIVKSFAIDKGLRQLSDSMMDWTTKPPNGSLKNKFTELALRFRLNLYDPIAQSRRNSKLF